MSDLHSHWMRLELQHANATEMLARLEVAVRERGTPADRERVQAVRASTARLKETLQTAASTQNAGWNAWVGAETASIELRFEMQGLVSAPGAPRDAVLIAVRDRIHRMEEEISALLAQSDRFRPRTRVAISQEAQRLRRRLDVLREEARRVESGGATADAAATRGMEHAWSEIEWKVEQTKRRFARPRWRQGRETAAARLST